MFPIIERNLCSVNAAGQLVDDSGRSVNVDSWKRHFVHCHDKCPGLSNPPGFLLRIDTKLMLSELLFAKNKSISVAPGRWADFKYPTLSAVQAPAPSPSSATPVRQPSVASPPIPQASPLLVDLNQTFPIALGSKFINMLFLAPLPHCLLPSRRSVHFMRIRKLSGVLQAWLHALKAL